MELKFYLRGLGLGIVVTAIIMGIASSKNQTMTDAEIIARAKQLGMIEDTVLKEKDSEEDNASEETAPENENTLQEETPEANTDTQPEEGDTDAEDVMPDDNTDADVTEPDADTNTEDTEADENEEGMGAMDTDTDADVSDASVVITIGNGDGSYSASQKLADAGLISSAQSFDSFLCENGYDKKIRPGTYTIPTDASDEQMAKIITGAR